MPPVVCRVFVAGPTELALWYWVIFWPLSSIPNHWTSPDVWLLCHTALQALRDICRVPFFYICKILPKFTKGEKNLVKNLRLKIKAWQLKSNHYTGIKVQSGRPQVRLLFWACQTQWYLSSPAPPLSSQLSPLSPQQRALQKGRIYS